MNNLLENIGLIILKILSWIGQIASSLIQNPIFIILMAIIIVIILWNILSYQTLIWDTKKGKNFRNPF